jgi:hypothetical protein
MYTLGIRKKACVSFLIILVIKLPFEEIPGRKAILFAV